MYRLRLTPDEVMVLRAVLTRRLAELGGPQEALIRANKVACPEPCEEIAVLTQLITQTSTWQRLPGSVPGELSSEELAVVDFNLSQAAHPQRYMQRYPGGTMALRSLSHKIKLLARPPSGPLALLRRLWPRGKRPLLAGE